jgi:hypothetical protein
MLGTQKIVVPLVALMLSLNAPVTAATVAEVGQSAKERYVAAEALRKGYAGAPDGAAAFAVMSGLAQEGYAPALEKLGYYHARGVGTVEDSEVAAELYRAAIAGGREKSRTAYAKLLMEIGQPDAALQQLETAVSADVASAALLLGEYHYKGKFGAAADAAFGHAEMTRFVAQGHVRSMGIVLLDMAKGVQFDLDAVELQARLMDVARDATLKDGGRAAEALVKALRGDASAAALRNEMLAHPLLREKVRVEEALWLAQEQKQGRAFWAAADEIVDGASPETFARALYVVSRIDKNAYVHVLQRELSARGYRAGRQTGMFNSRTLRAVTKLCAAREITKTCRYGPLRSQVIKLVAAEMAAMPPVVLQATQKTRTP